MVTKSNSIDPVPEAELDSWIDRLDPKHQKIFRTVRAAVREQVPTANELAYDYTSHVVISYSPSEHAIEALLAIDGREDGVRLYLMNLPKSSDPKKLLQGSGKLARFVPLETANALASPDVQALIAAAIEHMARPLPSDGKGRLIMKSGAAKKPSRGKA